MAKKGRKCKNSLDYFPLPVDFFNEPCINAVAVEFGIKGELVAVKLLCEIYRNGYYLDWSPATRVGFLRLVQGVNDGLLQQIARRLAEWDFLSETMLDEHGILTSQDIQQRYFAVTKRRIKDVSTLPYLLVEPPVAGKNEFLQAENQFMYAENQFAQAEMTQNKIKIESSTSSTNVLSPPGSKPPKNEFLQAENQFMYTENQFAQAETIVPNPRKRISASRNNVAEPVKTAYAVEFLYEDHGWLESTSRVIHKTIGEIKQYLDIFLDFCISQGKEEHESLADVKQHFNSWVKMHEKIYNRGKGSVNDAGGEIKDPVPLKDSLGTKNGDIGEKARTRFVKPTVEEISEYRLSRKNGIDPQQFFDYYETNGWVQSAKGKPLKDWKAAVRTWEKKEMVKPTLEEVKAFIEMENLTLNAEQWWNHYQANGWMIGRSRMQSWQAALKSDEFNKKKQLTNGNNRADNFSSNSEEARKKRYDKSLELIYRLREQDDANGSGIVRQPGYVPGEL